MQKLYDLVVKTGSYNDRQGNEKARWLTVGSMMEKDGNKFIMLHRTFNPAGVPDLSGKGSDSVLVSMFEPKERDQGGAAAEIPKPTGKRDTQWSGSQVDDRDVPF
jgi:hypothetical protein